jgi:carbon storage regulator
MLILSRRPNESLVIGSEVTLTVLGIKGNQVRLGINAPRDVVIDRAEVRRRKMREVTLTTVTLLPSSLTTSG